MAGVRLTTKSATGKVGFIRAVGEAATCFPDFAGDSRPRPPRRPPRISADSAPAFGAANGQLVQTDVTADRYGWTVTFNQQYKGVDVFGRC